MLCLPYAGFFLFFRFSIQKIYIHLTFDLSLWVKHTTEQQNNFLNNNLFTFSEYDKKFTFYINTLHVKQICKMYNFYINPGKHE